MTSGIVELDIHGMTKRQAKIYIDSHLNKVKRDTYRIRIIHGYRGGTELREMVKREYGKAHSQVLRIERGLNPGETDLVLRELY